MTQIPYCKDCRHCERGPGNTFAEQMDVAKCAHPDIVHRFLDVVSGEDRVEKQYCVVARLLDPHGCGPEGRKFQQKPSVIPGDPLGGD